MRLIEDHCLVWSECTNRFACCSTFDLLKWAHTLTDKCHFSYRCVCSHTLAPCMSSDMCHRVGLKVLSHTQGGELLSVTLRVNSSTCERHWNLWFRWDEALLFISCCCCSSRKSVWWWKAIACCIVIDYVPNCPSSVRHLLWDDDCQRRSGVDFEPFLTGQSDLKECVLHTHMFYYHQSD